MSTRSVPLIQRHRINILRAVFLCLLPLLLFTRSGWETHPAIHETMEAAGALLVIGGVLGRFWSILYSGGRKNATVVQDGPYSMCRHPLYLFSTMAVVGFGILIGSFVLTLAFGGLTFLILMMTARKEEAFLRDKFGPAYDDYARRVPAILPRPSLFRTAGEVTFDVAHLRRNFQDAVVFLAFIPLAEFMEFLHETGAVPAIALY